MSRRVVLDTNVLLDLWVFDDPAARPLRAALDRGDCTALRSRDTDAELAAVLARAEFALSAQQQRALLDRWSRQAQLIERVFPAPWPCRDPADQPFVDLAVSGHADLVVSKDKALLALARKARSAGLLIASPSAVAGLLTADGEPISNGV